jgi:hypothetical protein
MSQPENSRQPGTNKKIVKKSGREEPDEMQTEEISSEESPDTEKKSPEALAITEEIAELLGTEDIILALQKFKADSEEKKIAVEFANSHVNFLNQLIDSDYKKGISRTDVEIREMLSHVNSMLKKKDEYLFSTIITHSPLHYRNIQKKFYAKIKKEDNEGKHEKKK